jgi:outer membrane protein OmpA-like peptidoglycan-associated protein
MIFALAMTFAATGCRKKPVDVTNLPGRTGKPGDQGPTSLPPSRPLTDDQRALGGGVPLPQNLKDWQNTHNTFREILAAHTVHFEYDSSAIKSSERAHVQAVADYLKGAPGDALLVEGHCDERGTEEYNRSLGERRALALREALIDMGADGMKITTISYGKDRKIALGNDEASHAQNRRGEFVVLRPK